MSIENTDIQRVSEAVNLLSEHFDTIQIFVTRHEPETENGTIRVHQGIGNWFARYGQVAEWMIRQDELTRRNVREE
jgi:hypothetical protein